jgi:excinuclease UvrABC ATPase subunit
MPASKAASAATLRRRASKLFHEQRDDNFRRISVALPPQALKVCTGVADGGISALLILFSHLEKESLLACLHLVKPAMGIIDSLGGLGL